MNDDLEWAERHLIAATINEQEAKECFVAGFCSFDTWKQTELQRDKCTREVRRLQGILARRELRKLGKVTPPWPWP